MICGLGWRLRSREVGERRWSLRLGGGALQCLQRACVVPARLALNVLSGLLCLVRPNLVEAGGFGSQLAFYGRHL